MRYAFLVLMCSVPAVIRAQSTTIPLGTRVRIETAPKQQTSGTLTSQTADTVVVTRSDEIRVPIAIASIYRIRVRDGTSHGAGALTGMAYGAAILGGGVLVLSLTSGDMPDMAPLFAVAGGVYGAIIGAGVGALIGRERWTAVYTNLSRVSVRAGPGGAPGIGVTFRF